MKIIVDTDPAIGYLFRDVDDALALLYLLARPEEFEVVGVTPVYGNASLARTTAKAREILEVAGRSDVPVHRGARGPRDICSDTPASRLLEEATKAYPGEVTVLALGPLTSVARAVLAGGGFCENVKRIVIMGGAVDRGLGVPPFSPLEFNFFRDPAAADAVLGSPCEKVVISADLCRQAIFTRRELDSLYHMPNRVAGYLANRIHPWLRLNQVVPFLPWKGGFVPWDVVAAVYIRRPGIFAGTLRKGVGVRTGGVPTGAIQDRPDREDFPADIPTTLDPRGLLDEFLEGIAAFGA